MSITMSCDWADKVYSTTRYVIFDDLLSSYEDDGLKFHKRLAAKPLDPLTAAISALTELNLPDKVADVCTHLPTAKSEKARALLMQLASLQIDVTSELQKLQAETSRAKLNKAPFVPHPKPVEQPLVASSSSGPAVSAEDHHRALEWTEDVPLAQMHHSWQEHRERFPLCSSCSAKPHA